MSRRDAVAASSSPTDARASATRAERSATVSPPIQVAGRGWTARPGRVLSAAPYANRRSRAPRAASASAATAGGAADPAPSPSSTAQRAAQLSGSSERLGRPTVTRRSRVAACPPSETDASRGSIGIVRPILRSETARRRGHRVARGGRGAHRPRAGDLLWSPPVAKSRVVTVREPPDLIAELRPLERRETDYHVDDAGIDVRRLGRVGVAFDEVRLRRRRSLERTAFEQPKQKRSDLGSKPGQGVPRSARRRPIEFRDRDSLRGAPTAEQGCTSSRMRAGLPRPWCVRPRGRFRSLERGGSVRRARPSQRPHCPSAWSRGPRDRAAMPLGQPVRSRRRAENRSAR